MFDTDNLRYQEESKRLKEIKAKGLPQRIGKILEPLTYRLIVIPETEEEISKERKFIGWTALAAIAVFGSCIAVNSSPLSDDIEEWLYPRGSAAVLDYEIN